jgi:pantoate kinase
MRQAMAFCPGHITGFFQICRHKGVLETGSRGAGFSITLGAESRVVLEDGEGKLDIFVNGAHAKARVTEMAMEKLLAGEKLNAKVFTTLQLPVAQGFGMSAAGALSSALAVAQLLGKGEDAAYEAAHEAEVTCGTGLGDIAALKCGGIEFRAKEGLQPYGEVVPIDGDLDVLLCKVGPTIDTTSVINNAAKSAAINESARKCVEKFAKDMSIDNLFEISHEFADASGLATDKVKAALNVVGKDGKAAMCMVGNSIFVTGPDLGHLERKLAHLGTVYEAKVDHKGPRLY